MNPPKFDLLSDALVSTGAGTWVWDSDLPDAFQVRWPNDSAKQDLRGSIADEDWHLLTSCLQQALLDEQTFQFALAVNQHDSDPRELQLLGARSVNAVPTVRVTGLCWVASDEVHHDAQSQWLPLAKLSHELRSPLAAVANQVHELAGQIDDAAICEELDSVYHSSIYMLRIIEDMLTAFRAGEPEPMREPQVLSTERLVEEVVAAAEDRARQKGLQFQMRQQTEFPTSFWAEPVALRRILQNLLDNAVKFTSHGEIILSLGVVESGEGAALSFEVEDTGPGIPTGDIARVFEPFSQGQAGQSKSAGLGIGLALGRQLAIGLDGDLAVESLPDKGSRFRLTIPARVPVDELDLEEQSALVPEITVVAPGIKVLLVDDHPLLSKLTERELSKLGCEVEVAGSAREAMARIEQHIPDLVILDLDLPDMSGCDLCQKLAMREQLSNCRFVAYSGSGDIANRKAAERAGFHAFYVKPSSAEELLST